MDQGKWFSFAARLYYALGVTYYLYHWLVLGGVSGVFLSVLTHAFHSNVIAVYLTPLWFTLLLWGTALWAKNRSLRFQSHNPGIQDLFLESVYVVLPNNEYKYERSVRIKALQDGVDHYQHKFSWSGGDGVSALQSVPTEFKVSVYKQPKDFQYVCRVPFERPLRRGEELTFTYSLRLIDTTQSAQPFLAHMVHYRIKQLVQKVKFEVPVTVSAYKNQIFTSMPAEIPIMEQIKPVEPGFGELVWDIKRPRIGYRYKITW